MRNAHGEGRSQAPSRSDNVDSMGEPGKHSNHWLLNSFLLFEFLCMLLPLRCATAIFVPVSKINVPVSHET